ncbi:unnamed protein product, partial [Aphanomyces euteiches]
MSAVAAFNGRHQDTPVALAYQGNEMDSAVEMPGEEVMDAPTRQLAAANKGRGGSPAGQPSRPSFVSRFGQAAARGREKIGRAAASGREKLGQIARG